MVSAEGGTDEGHRTPMVKRHRLRFGWRLLFALVFMVGSGHLLVLSGEVLSGEAPRRELSLSSFALMWVSAAAGLLLLEWWDRRSRDHRAKPPRRQWRGDAPRWLVMAWSVDHIYVCATWSAGYITALGGQLKLLWADVLIASAFALAAIIHHWSKPYRIPKDSEAAVGGR
ncbi:hypothetical protein ACNAW0_25595 [Micromonospora sp. SL1-18]|uniref:hypothetical protein n=1 Tax=Micromonospora sp. SL1-18 TaxID=3399128 RepID=UPI003A4D468F